jgi:hypothetical protein
MLRIPTAAIPTPHRAVPVLMDEEYLRKFDSTGAAYKQAFQIFLDHTDQKRNARRWLQKIVDGLPNRRCFIDAGAGTARWRTRSQAPSSKPREESSGREGDETIEGHERKSVCGRQQNQYQSI